MRHIGKRPWSCIVALLLSACGGGTPAPAAAPVEVPVSVNAQPTPAPLAMFVHGGGWVQGEPSDAALLVPAFASWGAVLETATYRFIPAVALADEITDVRAEVARVRKSSTQPMVVIGHSTGAHLAAAAVLGADDGKPVCLVLLDGVGLDLPKMLREQRGVQVRLSLTPEQAVM